MYNHLDVEGGYNVGGIVGNLENGSTVQNVSNDGNVKATGYITGYYNYHTNNKSIVSTANMNKSEIASKPVNVANVGGIVGNSTGDTDTADSIKTTNIIKDVLNNGDISAKLDTTTNASMPYYTAGNVGGVVGSAVNTDISSATNKESNIRGAHNVGGIAGYFEDGTITKAINNGGDIMATGARNGSAIVKERIRYDSGIGSDESFIVGNIGGIVGYMYGDSAYINTSANRGTVHTEDIADESNILDTSKAANVGGIVGKIDRENTISIAEIKTDIQKPTNEQQNKYAIRDSYNTGNVRGYTGVGGVAGMMYNGEIVDSYNIGEIRSTRKDATSLSPLNMGGIVGDSTEETSAKISLYDVYNKGQIGDEEFVYKGRHVGGIAGRLSGYVEKSYNDGDIYNGANITGGIAGWWVKGDITNSFNTGNITNYSTTTSGNGSNVGGIAGGMGIYKGGLEPTTSNLINVYNLGTIRSIKGAGGSNGTVGGMIGTIGGSNAPGHLTIENVYTLGNLYSVDNGKETVVTNMVGSYYGGGHNVKINNAYYIDTTGKGVLSNDAPNTNIPKAPTEEIENGNKDDLTEYGGFTDSDWRIYKGTTPILNAFMPETNGKFNDKNVVTDGIGNITNVQYGTAYDPLLTIINTNDNITLDWKNLGIYGDAGLAVYSDKNGNGGGLTLNNFKNSTQGVGLFGGIIYSDGALNIKSYDGDENTAENIGLGSFSKLYGASVTIDAGKTGTVDSYGSIISTGNNNIKGDITITGANVNTYGEIKTAVKGQITTIDGIKGSINDAYDDNIGSNLTNQNAEMPNIAEGYAHTVTAGANSTGNVSITATDGDVNIYYGNMEKGIIDTQGDVTLVGNNVYVDSDMVIGGDLTTTADSTGEIVVDISNIGKVSLDKYTDNLYKELKNNNGKLTKDKINTIITNLESVNKIDPTQLDDFIDYLYTTYVNNSSNELKNNATESAISDAIIKGRMHNFLKSFSTDTSKYINFVGTDNAKITVDLWDGSGFKLDKYDQGTNTLKSELDKLDIRIGENKILISSLNPKQTGKDFVYIWVADGEQLKGIQTLAGTNSDVLNYNFALKNDINATDVSGYQAIGSGDKAFTGKFDGRGNRIIGLNVDNTNNHTSTDNVGVFGVNAGTIKNLKVYSSTFKGYDNVGAIAGTNNGTIDNVTTLGNTVEAVGSNYSNDKLDTSKVGAAGGVVGTNTGTVNNATSRDSVIAGEDKNSNGALTTAGGIAGINTGLVSNSQSHSAVTASKTSTYSLGGIVGVNTAKDNTTDNKITAGLDNVNAYGVTSGIYSEASKPAYATSSNIGGIAGVNSGTLHDAYNESIVKGLNNIGGIAGINSGDISLIVNGASITAEGNYTGGLVGSTTGKISDGRNNGVITGVNYVGGLVGSNGSGVILEDLTNDSSAEITGEKYVGGIAGTNSGSISTTDTNLINRGSITGNQYVGGIAGENNGTIANVNNDIVLNATGSDAKYFGGVTGINTKDGTITNATNRGDINANGATYVGGIAGENNGTLNEFNGNYGNVTGGDKVGGAVGKNTVAINNAELVSAGTVTSAGGAGGIFAENSGKITNSDLSNSGTVIGGSKDSNSGTGGLIGINSGDIEKTSLRNEVNGNVTGTNNVGGLIGINSGTITGGRDDADTYYKYQIYNNGTITAKNGSNIGGLIGKNNGNLTAGYNTGNIAADGSNNVGGIVGTNEGTVKEVFNTIAGNGSVTGNTNVGGLIGTNSGTLSNAYSTSIVVGKTNVGNVVGDNTNGTVTNIYATNTSGNLVGTNNGKINISYSFSSSDNNKNGITYLEKDEQKDKDKYTSFDENTWKFYDGNANPLLKVFLTKAEFVPTKDKDGNNVKPYFVYNGNKQGVLIHYDEKNKIVEVLDAKNIVIGTIKVANEDAAHSLEDYINTIGKDNQLINGVQFIDAGTYEMLFSQQINTDGKNGNPNNLGFDFVTSLDNTNPNDKPPTITNDKAQINITLNDIERIYGNLNINKGNYGFIYGIANGQLTDEMEKELLNKLQLGSVDITKDDGALIENGTKTNNVGNYTWSGTVTLDNSLLSNYEFTNKEGSITTTGNSKVTPKTLTLKDLLATIVYGNQDNKGLILQKPNNNTDILNGIVYGDDVNINLGNITLGYKNDSAYDKNKGNRVTADVGTYENSLVVGNISLTNNEKGNYKLDTTTTGGSIKVTPAALTINLNKVYHTYGDPNLDDYGVSNVTGLTNGDKASIGVTMTEDTALKDNNAHTNDAGENYTWTGTINGIEGLGNNYIIKVNEGQSVVNKAKLDIIIDNTTIEKGEHPNYNGQFGNDSGTNNFTNGDTPDTVFGSNWDWGITNPSLENETGTHGDAITIIINGNQYITSKEDIDKILPNYDVNISFGDLTVKDNGSSVPITPIEPIKPVVPGIWSHIYQDQWDRNRDFKERKAEFNFVDGAIPLDEAVEEA